MARNEILNSAAKNKNDEFYTQYNDIQRELNCYLDYDENVFAGKTILLPCDDPDWSNFTRFFVANFKRYKMKKLISTSYFGSSLSALGSDFFSSNFSKSIIVCFLSEPLCAIYGLRR